MAQPIFTNLGRESQQILHSISHNGTLGHLMAVEEAFGTDEKIAGVVLGAMASHVDQLRTHVEEFPKCELAQRCKWAIERFDSSLVSNQGAAVAKAIYNTDDFLIEDDTGLPNMDAFRDIPRVLENWQQLRASGDFSFHSELLENLYKQVAESANNVKEAMTDGIIRLQEEAHDLLEAGVDKSRQLAFDAALAGIRGPGNAAYVGFIGPKLTQGKLGNWSNDYLYTKYTEMMVFELDKFCDLLGEGGRAFNDLEDKIKTMGFLSGSRAFLQDAAAGEYTNGLGDTSYQKQAVALYNGTKFLVNHPYLSVVGSKSLDAAEWTYGKAQAGYAIAQPVFAKTQQVAINTGIAVANSADPVQKELNEQPIYIRAMDEYFGSLEEAELPRGQKLQQPTVVTPQPQPQPQLKRPITPSWRPFGLNLPSTLSDHSAFLTQRQ